MNAQIEKAAAVLIGKPLWACGRAADMATFQFGARVKTKDFFGKTREVGGYALHVQCAWRFRERDRILVGSRDLYYPADYEDANQEFPKDFDWSRDPNRRDKLVLRLFENGTRGFAVQRITGGAAASLGIVMADNYSLEIFPDDSLPGEHWRLFAPGDDASHFVVTGLGIETDQSK